ncbi:hypothetical protein [Pseudomonas glycinae]|uniref:hypothetical protein n=1 Tax=Pseudomonas glycinae TaxID=1785145 RepID=UPI00167EF9E3|nr:hypothetical protein [Pseudomonas glycinae]
MAADRSFCAVWPVALMPAVGKRHCRVDRRRTVASSINEYAMAAHWGHHETQQRTMLLTMATRAVVIDDICGDVMLQLTSIDVMAVCGGFSQDSTLKNVEQS